MVNRDPSPQRKCSRDFGYVTYSCVEEVDATMWHQRGMFLERTGEAWCHPTVREDFVGDMEDIEKYNTCNYTEKYGKIDILSCYGRLA